jgi:hypothetical protein
LAWTVDQLLADVKRKANLPPGPNAKLSDVEMLRIADEVILTQLDPILLTLQEEYDVAREDFTVTPGDSTYRLPERAVSGTIIQALLVNANGEPQPLERIGGSEAWRFEGATRTATYPSVYAIEGNTLRLLPTPSVTGLSLRLRYRRRPAELVLTTTCGLVSIVGATTVTAPGGSFGVAPIVDIVRSKPPVGPIVQGAAATYAANVFTFGAGVLTDAGVSVGDYVCAYDTTCIVPLPERFSKLAIGLVAAAVLVEWGDLTGAAAIEAAMETYVTRLTTAQSNRAAAQPLSATQAGEGLLSGFFGGWR